MRIIGIDTEIRDYPLRQDLVIVSAAGRHAASRYLLVKVIDADGVAGYGEAATMPLWSGEAADPAQWVVNNLLAPLVVDATWDHPSEPVCRMDRHVVGHPFAKAAIDMALWDVYARFGGRSVLSLIGDREPCATIPTRASIGAYPPQKTLAIARMLAGVGICICICTLKFKVGVPGVDDVERLAMVRGELGDDLVFTVDANGGYGSVDDAVRAAEAMMPFNVVLLEQPTPRGRLHLLAEVRRRVSMAVMADESVFTPDDLAEAIDLDAFDVLSVYPGKDGGSARLTMPGGQPFEGGKPVTGVIDLGTRTPGLWSFTAEDRVYICVRNVPPFFAFRDPESYFEPVLPAPKP